MTKVSKKTKLPKRGRPKGQDRPVSLSLRLTKKEKKFLDEASEAAGLSIAEYMRRAIEIARAALVMRKD